MAEITLTTLSQAQLDRLVRQLEDSALEIATLTAERDSARQQSTVNAPAPTNAPAQSEELIIISSGTPTQNNSVGHRSGVASEGTAHSMPGMERNRAAPSPREPREARRHVEFAATSGEYAVTAPMPLMPQRLPCFDPSQHGGPTVQSWVFTMNVFFDANYVESDAAKIRYATAQYSTWDAWCAGLRARFEPIAALISARQELRTWRQLGFVQDYTSSFLALCEQVGYMHEAERVDRYVGGLKPDISHEIMLRGLLNFNEILALAKKIDILRRSRPGFSYFRHAALGFAPSTADPSLFLRTDTSLPPFYVLVYVDDLVFATADTAGLAHVKSELQKRHTCTDLGELRSYLGLQITRDRAQRTITLTQSHMVQQVLQRFDFTYSLPQATPLSTRHSLSALPSDESVEPSGAYPELVGCLMYLMTCTRPDLAYPLSILARYIAPGRHRPEHMAAAKRVLRYLCSTSGLGLVLGGRRPVVLTGHADASWADDQTTQRSSQGYTFSLGSGSVSWRSTRSSFVLSSSCEAEIYAGAMAAQELRWLTYLLTDLGEPPRSPPVLYVDNKAMLALCREHRLEHRTKHIALRYFLARELQQRGQLRLAYVASEANTADFFTKALPPGDHQRFRTMLDCVSPESSTVHVNAITMKRVAAAGADVYAVDIAMVEEAEQPSDFQKLLAGVEIDPKKLDTVKAWHPPTNITELHSFLGFVNYVHRFVTDMARLTAPLKDLLRKGVTFTWGEKEHAAFYTLKNLLCSPPVLRIADPHRPFEVVTDASDIAIGAVLLLDFGNGLQPIAYESRKLHPPEKNYPIHAREMLVIVQAFKVWRCYFTGADVTVRTDHKSLQYLRAQPHLNQRQINPAHSPTPRHTTCPDQPTTDKTIYPWLSD
ncbi:unnamed protein product [Closterium sp. NIES-54]